MPEANQQAYTGFAGLADGNSEWNRLQFAIRMMQNKQATATLVLVKAVGDGTVDVQPMVAQTDGAGNAVPHGTIHGLPVWRLQGGASAVVVVPAVGDIGLAVFAHSDISAVKRAKAPTTPGSARKFDWSDGVYLGGVLNAEPTQFIRMDDDGITITAAAGQPVTINADSVTMSGTLDVTGAITSGAGSTFGGKAFDTHKHSGVTAGAANTGNPI